MNNYDVRRENLRTLISLRFNGKQAALADAISRSANYISRCLSTGAGRKNIGEDLARDIERKTGLPKYALDSPGGVTEALREPSNPPVADTVPTHESPVSQAESNTQRLSDLQQALLASTEGLGFGQVADVIAYARQLRTGRTVALSAPTPITEHSYLDEPISKRAQEDRRQRDQGPPRGLEDRRGPQEPTGNHQRLREKLRNDDKAPQP